jgi:hypothetical protein
VREEYDDIRRLWDGQGAEPHERVILYGALLCRFAELLRNRATAARLPPPA